MMLISVSILWFLKYAEKVKQFNITFEWDDLNQGK